MDKKIYRYEIKCLDGYRGPYNAIPSKTTDSEKYEKIRENIMFSHGGSSDHLDIKRDLNILISDWDLQYHCACPSLDILMDWFTGFNDDLQSLGFIIIEYTVKEFKLSNSGRQGIFTYDNVIERKELIKPYIEHIRIKEIPQQWFWF